jgi:hypothetical protein
VRCGSSMLADEHGRTDHVHDPRAVARRAAIEADNEILPEAATALDRIRLAQMLQQPGQQLTNVTSLMRAQPRRKRRARARRSRRRRGCRTKAAANAVKPPSVSQKKQKTAAFAFAASAAGCAETCACAAGACGGCVADDVEPTYANWTEARWKELETKARSKSGVIRRSTQQIWWSICSAAMN